MSIRENVRYKNGRHNGFVDLNTDIIEEENDNLPLAKCVWVFLTVFITSGWKIPIVYFLINSLTANERANLLLLALELLHESQAEVTSITFDGMISNVSMCKILGANFNLGSNFAPFFLHLIKKKIFVIWDPCHILKLIRNTLAETGDFVDSNGQEVSWEHIVLLREEEEIQQLKVATKLTPKHIDFVNMKMNVRLAAQTFSDSVAKGLRFMNDDAVGLSKFPNTKGTAEFCQKMNDIFDLLNVRNL